MGCPSRRRFIDDYVALIELAGRARPRPGWLRAPTRRAELGGGAGRAGVVLLRRLSRGHALSDVSLDIGPGEVVALVGENGSGKTTLAKVLAGLCAPAGGQVTWNGVDAGDDPGQGRSDLTVVFQDFVHYALAAGETSASAVPTASPMTPACGGRAQAGTPEIDRLPEGYTPSLGPAFTGGADLSLGQWQRVAFARALFRDAPFVVLDEPTAALDPRAEQDLFAGDRALFAGRGVLRISHRFSSVRDADRIHVLPRRDHRVGHARRADGRGGHLCRLFRLQAAPYL